MPTYVGIRKVNNKPVVFIRPLNEPSANQKMEIIQIMELKQGKLLTIYLLQNVTGQKNSL